MSFQTESSLGSWSEYNTIQIKLGWALFVTYTIIQSTMRSEMCSLHLIHPSVHTWSSGQPTVQRPGSSRGLPVGAGIQTHNLGLPRVSSPTLYPLGQRQRADLLKWTYRLLFKNNKSAWFWFIGFCKLTLQVLLDKLVEWMIQWLIRFIPVWIIVFKWKTK